MTPYTKQIVELHKIHKAIENCGCNKDEQGGGDNEKVAFEDWKRNPLAFPVEDVISFGDNPVEFYITELNAQNTGLLGGVFLGIANKAINLIYNSTVEELFNINSNDFKDITDKMEFDIILSTIQLFNDSYLEKRKEQFPIEDLYEEIYNRYNLSYLEANTITEIATYKILLIKFIDKNNASNIFYTTGKKQEGGGTR